MMGATMALKPNGKTCAIREQILEDPVSGLTFQIEADNDGGCTLRVFGDALPYGNREFVFVNGTVAGAGTALTPRRATWLV